MQSPGDKLPKHFRINPGFPGTPAFIGRHSRNMNCVNCVVTIDNILSQGKLQMAIPNQLGENILELENLYNNNFIDVFSKEHIEILLEEAGFGARGIVYGEVKGSEVGHVINVANLSGKIVFIDGQRGRYANIEELVNLALLRTN